MNTAIKLNYQKRNNLQLFDTIKEPNILDLKDIQSYNPIYTEFFNLCDKNYKHVNLNHLWHLHSIDITSKLSCKNIIECCMKNSVTYKTKKVPVFFKIAPLLDPYKYLSGKYKQHHTQNLPSITKSPEVHQKLYNTNNSSYTDGFFCFLISHLYSELGFIHGISYYGSFLAIKNNYKIDIIDDLEYLIHRDFFLTQQDKLFKIDDYSHLCLEYKSSALIKISDENMLAHSNGEEIDELIFKDIFDTSDIDIKTDTNLNINEYILPENKVEGNINLIEKKGGNMSMSTKSSSSTSTTNLSDDSSIKSIQQDDEDDEDDGDNGDDEDDGECEEEDGNSTSSYSTYEDETIMATINKFPVQLICMDVCDNTFHSLIESNSLNEDEWLSALMQIIMVLITYNKLFLLTHNDLHTNNVMYVTTSKRFIYYLHNDTYYKVPTFGRIFKIIDFGRAIYRFQGKLFCSDSYHPKGDASCQYNTEPYFNSKKKRIDPNVSFDLCRLGCSILDCLFNDIREFKDISVLSPLERIIVEWCTDDHGCNIMYNMKTGCERYHDFDLYKMIARTVHNNVPSDQLERPEFKKYKVSNVENIDKHVKNKNNAFVQIDKYAI